MKIYWRPECYDSSGNFMDECEMTEDEMLDFYEWHKSEFYIPSNLSLSAFVKWQGFEIVER